MNKFITALTMALLLSNPAFAWISNSNTDSFTGDKTAVLKVDSKEPLSCSYRGSHATLVIRCKENTTEVYLITDCHLTDSDYDYDYSKVQYKLDDGSIKEFKGSISTDSSAFFYPHSDITFIKSMFGHSKLTMRFTPYSKSNETVTFDIEGIQNVVGTVAETCNWKK